MLFCNRVFGGGGAGGRKSVLDMRKVKAYVELMVFQLMALLVVDFNRGARCGCSIYKWAPDAIATKLDFRRVIGLLP